MEQAATGKVSLSCEHFETHTRMLTCMCALLLLCVPTPCCTAQAIMMDVDHLLLDLDKAAMRYYLNKNTSEDDVKPTANVSAKWGRLASCRGDPGGQPCCCIVFHFLLNSIAWSTSVSACVPRAATSAARDLLQLLQVGANCLESHRCTGIHISRRH